MTPSSISIKTRFSGERTALFFLLLGISLIGLFIALERHFPMATQLELASGRVAWTHPAQGGLYFALSGVDRQFVVYTKGDSEQRLRAAVSDAQAYPIRVHYHPEQVASPGLLPGRYYTVYGVTVGGKEVLNLAAVQASYRRDNAIALLLGLLFAAYGGRCLWQFRAAPGRRL